MLLHCCYTTVYSVTTQLKKKENINVSLSCVAKSSHGSGCLLLESTVAQRSLSV